MMDPYTLILEYANCQSAKLDNVYDTVMGFLEAAARGLHEATPEVEAFGMFLGAILYFLFHAGFFITKLLMYCATGIADILVTMVMLELLLIPIFLVVVVVGKLWEFRTRGEGASLDEERGVHEETPLLADRGSWRDDWGSSDGTRSPEFNVFAEIGREAW